MPKNKSKGKSQSDSVKLDNPLAAVDSIDASAEFEDLVDAWPTKDGKMVLDVQKGQEMCKGIQDLYVHLRKQAIKGGGGRDNFGLWKHVEESDDEDEGANDSKEKHSGEMHFDAAFVDAQKAMKKTKHAMKIGNPDAMAPDELKRELAKFKQSTKGDPGALRSRLKAAYELEATKMRGNTRVVMHFNSDRTQRNLQQMIAKVNARRASAVQDKLKGAHTDLREAHASLRDMQAQIDAQKAMLADLQAQLARPREVVRKVIEPMGVPKMALTMAVSTKLSGTTKANWDAWSISQIAQEKAQLSKCQVLVLDTSGFKWEKAFKKMKTKDGRPIECRHSAWHLINVASTSHFGGQAVVDQLIVTEDGAAHERFIPDCVLIRDRCRQVNGEDHTHQLMGMICSRTPCVNEAGAVLNCLDRPVVYSELLNIRNVEGEKDGAFKFPLIDQEYFANEAPASIRPTFPTVTKLSTVASGFGKLRAEDEQSFGDMSSILALSSEYFTTEESMEVAAEIYIQWINGSIRCFKRVKSSSYTGFRTWSDWGTVQYQEVDQTKQYKKWAELVSNIFGGLDIFALNVIQTESGEEYILGIQDSSCPFAPQYQSEDAAKCAELVIERIEQTRKERAKYVKYN
jgi:hypothetical protein